MKLYIVTIDEVYDYVDYGHKPEPYLSLAAARRRLNEIYRQAREEYEPERFTGEDRGENSFSIYEDGSWSDTHYDARISEVDLPGVVPASSLRVAWAVEMRETTGDEQVRSVSCGVFTTQRKAMYRFKAVLAEEEKKYREKFGDSYIRYPGNRYAFLSSRDEKHQTEISVTCTEMDKAIRHENNSAL